MPSTITPFRIEIPDAAVEDLRSRLRNARFSEPLPGDGWDTGVPNSVLRTTVGLWSAHDWRATETRLNRLPQLTTRINGQTVHAAHVRSGAEEALPLLLVHGWPAPSWSSRAWSVRSPTPWRTAEGVRMPSTSSSPPYPDSASPHPWKNQDGPRPG